ncbi:gp79 [Bacillus phage G]|uniref:Gp79 n=1 Tax=Bacillus phage G TaxID=2884420 RepID=G3MBE9_9CAUD|nr:gp79 [Bacillus phage G]AEO93350.1 gp79 [Bacillus phage G]
MHISKVNDILDSIKEIDVATYDHLERTAMFTFAIAKELKFESKQMEQAYFAGLLHDIGVLSATNRNKKECAEFGSLMLRFVDDSKFLSDVIKHMHDFYLQEESFNTLLSEIVAVSSEYDELKNVEGLEYDKVFEVLKSKKYQDRILDSFDKVLKKEELI